MPSRHEDDTRPVQLESVPPPREPATRRVSLDLSESHMALLEELMVNLDRGSKADTLREAIVLLSRLYDEEHRGVQYGTLCDGQWERFRFFPLMKRVTDGDDVQGR